MNRTDQNRIFLTLLNRFIYERDPKSLLDNWKWPSKKETLWVKGDCEDFSLQLLFDLSGQSWVWFWWYLISCQAVIWHVTSYRGNGHAVLWFRGRWADNMEVSWYKTSNMRHTRRFPYLAPMVLLKLTLASIFNKG